MTNGEKYKRPEERHKAFYEMCESHKTCTTCPIAGTQGDLLACAFQWLDLKVEKDKTNEE